MREIQRVLLAAVIAIPVVGAAVGFLGPSARSDSVSGPALYAAASLQGDCGSCACCDPWCLSHSGAPGGGDGVLHECIDGVCSSHPRCPFAMAPDDLGTVWYAVLRGSADDVRRVLAQWPQFVRLNVERRAVQVESCGNLIAHITLPAEHAAALNL